MPKFVYFLFGCASGLFVCCCMLLFAIYFSNAGLPPIEAVNAKNPSVEIKTDEIVMRNNTYLPLVPTKDFRSKDDNEVRYVLGNMDSFQQKHPELRIINWHVDKAENWIVGIWIQHEPKQNSVADSGGNK